MTTAPRPDPQVLPEEWDYWLGQVRNVAGGVWSLHGQLAYVLRTGKVVPDYLNEDIRRAEVFAQWTCRSLAKRPANISEVRQWSDDQVQAAAAVACVFAGVRRGASQARFHLRGEMVARGMYTQYAAIAQAVRQGRDEATVHRTSPARQVAESTATVLTAMVAAAPADGLREAVMGRLHRLATRVGPHHR